MTALLSTHGLGVEIADLAVCRDLDLRIEPGTRWAILGRNGVGKTTLLRALAGLHRAARGEVRLDGRPLDAWPKRHVAQRLGILFQDTAAVFPGTVLETVLIGRHPHLERWRWEGDEDLELARAALAEVDLAGTEDRNVATLSGGERQRVAIAAVLCQSPALWLLDEPTNHLDPRHQVETMETVRRAVSAGGALLHRTSRSEHPREEHPRSEGPGGKTPRSGLPPDATLPGEAPRPGENRKTAAPGAAAGEPRSAGRAAILVLHDVNLAVRYCDHALLLHGDGVVDHGPAASVINPDSLRRLYGHPMEAITGGDVVYYMPGEPTGTGGPHGSRRLG